jgi:hypothetical protein
LRGLDTPASFLGLRVEQSTLETSGVGEANCGGEALAEGTGRDLHAVGVAILRVTGGKRTPGAEGLEVVELEAVAAEVELYVLRQRAVADGQHEAVTSKPVLV